MGLTVFINAGPWLPIVEEVLRRAVERAWRDQSSVSGSR